jgi:AcrR family transcriptional regulator
MAANNEMLERILNATLTMLGRRGVRKLSMSDVSVEAGIARGILYHYVSDKQDLLRAIAVHVESAFEEAVLTESISPPSWTFVSRSSSKRWSKSVEPIPRRCRYLP